MYVVPVITFGHLVFVLYQLVALVAARLKTFYTQVVEEHLKNSSLTKESCIKPLSEATNPLRDDKINRQRHCHY